MKEWVFRGACGLLFYAAHAGFTTEKGYNFFSSIFSYLPWGKKRKEKRGDSEELVFYLREYFAAWRENLIFDANPPLSELDACYRQCVWLNEMSRELGMKKYEDLDSTTLIYKATLLRIRNRRS